MNRQRMNKMVSLYIEGCRDVSELAKKLRCSERQVYRIFTTKLFRRKLRAGGVLGAIKLSARPLGPQRNKNLYNRLKQEHAKLVEQGVPRHKQIVLLMQLEDVDVSKPTLTRWRSDWEKGVNRFSQE